MSEILQYFSLPESCHFDSNIPKKLFFDSGVLNTADKKVFTDQISRIALTHHLNSNTVNIEVYQDDIRQYDEIAFITIQLEEEKKAKRIAQIVQQVIPYPIVLMLVCDDRTLINVCHKRTNQADKSKNTIEEHHFADWLDAEALSANDMQFLESIAVQKLSYTSMYHFYSGIVDRVIWYKAVKYATDFNSVQELDADTVNKVLHDINEINEALSALRNDLKNEANFNEKMRMNIEMKKLEQRKNVLVEGLR